MPMSFKDLVIQFSLISLLVFSTLSFVIQFQIENNANSTILENDLINATFVDLSDSISNQQSSGNNSQEAFDSDIPSPGFGSLIIFAIVGVAQTFTSAVATVWNIIIILPLRLIGIPSQVANVLGFILSVTLIFTAWRVYRVGS